MIVYGDIISGNCFKIKLLLSFLNIDHEWRHIDILKKETQSDEFLKLNPNGKIPTVVLSDGRVLCESNAILSFLAEGTRYLPRDSYQKAKVFEWMFFEQYSHEPFIAVARFIKKYQGMPESRLEEFKSLKLGGHKALTVMEQQLANTQYLVGDNLSIADIALYGYTHVSHEGGFSLNDYPNIQRWIARIQKEKGYLGMDSQHG